MERQELVSNVVARASCPCRCVMDSYSCITAETAVPRINHSVSAARYLSIQLLDLEYRPEIHNEQR